jgi:predicted enzyme related to lactoylglutathione lyase
VSVADIARAKHFYEQQLSFTVDHDTTITADMRVVQFTPPGLACSIAIGNS